MNKGLARTLAAVLANFIDDNRNGGMCMSNGECMALEDAFIEENFDKIEAFLERKLTRDAPVHAHKKKPEPIIASMHLKISPEKQKELGRMWMDALVNQPIQELVSMKEQILKDSFFEHFKIRLEDVRDTENLEHIIIPGNPISSFCYRGETFLYMQDDPDFKIDGDRITFTSMHMKV